MKREAAFVVLLLLLITHRSEGSRRFLNSNFSASGSVSSSSSSSLSSVVTIESSSSSGRLTTTTVTCDSLYGFLPCTATTEVWGQLFLIVVYEYLLLLAQKYVSTGSDLFFKLVGTGIFGASLFQILGSIPQVAIILVTGISEDTATAESLTSMGLASLAGSAVMSLTLIWGCIVAFGSYDISTPTETTTTSTSSDASTPFIPTGNKTSFSLTGFGVTTDTDTTWTARIMLMSIIPFLILQLPQILNSTVATRVAILIALIISIAFLLAYCIYQVFQPWIQDRRLDYILLKFVRDSMLEFLLDSYGNPDKSSIKKLFHNIDQNKDGKLSKSELEALFIGIQLKEVGLDEDDYVSEVMKQFDFSRDDVIEESEFVKGMEGWLNKANGSKSKRNQDKQVASSSTTAKTTTTTTTTTTTATQGEQKSQVGESKKSDGIEKKAWFTYMKAAFLVILGTTMSIILGQPLMTAVQNFGGDINIPSFIISYVVLPLAMSYRSTISSIKSARQKTEKAVSLTFSATYGGVFMNNVMSLTMYLLIVYIRDLTWNVSAGVFVVLIIGLIMGFTTSFSTKFPFWTSIVAFLLYPLSLVLIYVLITYFGWS